jgi:hypothetical protein
MLLVDVIIKTENHTSKAVLFYSLKQEKIGSCVAFVPEPRRKADKRKLDSELHTILLVVFHSLLYLQAHLQHQIE